MELSRAIASMAVVLGVILAAGYAQGEAGAPQQTAQDAFERACNKPLKSEMEFALCRAAYKRLEPAK
jgi:hypothetical protein